MYTTQVYTIIYIYVCVLYIYTFDLPLPLSRHNTHGVQKKYLRDQQKIFFSCAGAVFWPFYAIFKSCGL